MQNTGILLIGSAFVLVVLCVLHLAWPNTPAPFTPRGDYGVEKKTLEFEDYGGQINPMDPDGDPWVLNGKELDDLLEQRDHKYKISEGDSIDDIAFKYLGDHTLKEELFRLNPHIPRNRRLPVGEEITIPFRLRR